MKYQNIYQKTLDLYSDFCKYAITTRMSNSDNLTDFYGYALGHESSFPDSTWALMNFIYLHEGKDHTATNFIKYLLKEKREYAQYEESTN